MQRNACGGHLVFQNEAKNIPRQNFMVMNISCKFEKARYNIFLVRAVTMKSLYTLRRRRRRNKVKSIVSTGCYPVDTMRYKAKSQNLLFYGLSLTHNGSGGKCDRLDIRLLVYLKKH